MKPLDPRIGMLCKEGRTVYYAFLHGHGKPETAGTLEEIEIALGLRPPMAKLPLAPAIIRDRNPKLRDYLVTVTPKMVTYSGSQRFSEWSIKVTAETRDKAIQQVRAEVRESEGRYGVPCTYRAKLAD